MAWTLSSGAPESYDGLMCCRYVALACLALLLVPASASAAARTERPHVTNACPVDALPLRQTDLPAVRRFALALAPHGVDGSGRSRIDYRDAHARIAAFPTFFTGLVRATCPHRAV